MAFADYVNELYMPTGNTRIVSPLRSSGSYFSADQATTHGNIGDNGLTINTVGQYLFYSIDGLSLSGKTITIELGGVVGTNLVSNWTKAYIADFGTEKWFVINNKNCT